MNDSQNQIIRTFQRPNRSLEHSKVGTAPQNHSPLQSFSSALENYVITVLTSFNPIFNVIQKVLYNLKIYFYICEKGRKSNIKSGKLWWNRKVKLLMFQVNRIRNCCNKTMKIPNSISGLWFRCHSKNMTASQNLTGIRNT